MHDDTELRYYVVCSLHIPSADMYDRVTGHRLTSIYTERERMLQASERLQCEASNRNSDAEYWRNYHAHQQRFERD